jgi:hypothetical protein
MRSLALLFLAATGCITRLPVTEVWTPPDHDDGTALVGAVDGDLIFFRDGHVARDGKVAWISDATPGWYGAPATPGGDLFVITRGEGDAWTIQRIAAATGTVTRVPLVENDDDGWYGRGAELYGIRTYDHRLRRIDAATGATLWTHDDVGYEVHVGDGVVWIGCEVGLCGLAAATGERVATAPATSWPKLTEDGRSLVVALDTEIRVIGARTGVLERTIPLPAGVTMDRVAASDRWIAATAHAGPTETDTLLVYARDTGALAWRHTTRKGSYLGYAAAYGDLVVYYDSLDETIHAVRPSTKKTGRVVEMHGALVISTDASGIAPAIPDAAPEIAGDVVLVKNFDRVSGYRVGF